MMDPICQQSHHHESHTHTISLLQLHPQPSSCSFPCPKHQPLAGLPSTDLGSCTVCTQGEMLSPPSTHRVQQVGPGWQLGSGHCPLSQDEHRLLEWLCNPSQTINLKFLKKHLPWFWLRVGTWCSQGKVAPSCFLQLLTFQFCCLSALWDGAICPHLSLGAPSSISPPGSGLTPTCLS